MGGSIAAGVAAALPDQPEALLVLLADQPEVDADYLAGLWQASTESPQRIVATEYPEGPGVPAIFPRRYHGTLLREAGRGGAKRLLRKTASVHLLRPPRPLVDLDTPEDYRNYTGQALPE